MRNHETRLDQEEEERAKAKRREEICAESIYQHQEHEPEPSSHNALNTSQPPCNFENAHGEHHTGIDEENDINSCHMEQDGEGSESSDIIRTGDFDEKMKARSR